MRDLPIALLLTLAVVAVAACGSSGSSGSSASAPAGPSGSGVEPGTSSTAPPAVPPSTVPGAPGGFFDTATPTACLDLDAAGCARARDVAASALAADDPPARYVQVGPFACAAGDRCPTTLAARPEGDVVIEFADGTGINVHLKVAADGTAEVSRAAAMGVSVAPTSAAGIAAGPALYALGHCGIFSGIDVDGSWWDPVGPVAMGSGDAVNATAGVLTVTDPEHASFTTPTGFALQLQRRAGPKLLPFCM